MTTKGSTIQVTRERVEIERTEDTLKNYCSLKRKRRKNYICIVERDSKGRGRG